MKFILRWIWPVYGFVFPLLSWPHTDVGQSHLLRILVTVIFILIGSVLEFHVFGLPSRANLVRRHPAPFLALAYGLWTLISSAFSKQPTISLIGDLQYMNDGALWTLCLCILLCLVYARTRRDPGQEMPVIIAVIASGLVLSVLGTVEVITGKSLVFQVLDGTLPVVTFPGPGHLGGFLVLSGALAVGWWLKSKQTTPWVLLAVFMTSFGMTLTNRRATLIALGASVLAGLNQPIRMVVVAVVLGAGILGGQQLVSKATAQGVRSFGKTDSLETRLYMWKAAVGGIAARPITGWGGSNFQYEWYRYLTRPELAKYMRLEFGLSIEKVIDIYDTPGGDRWIIYRNLKGQRKSLTVSWWKAHNQFLDVLLMWGVVGLALYMLIASMTLQNFYLPGVVALASYQVFALIWYVPLEVEGVMFQLVGFTTAMGYRPTRVRELNANPSPVRT